MARRRASWVEEEGRVAEKARDGFHSGVVTGLVRHGAGRSHQGKRWLAGEPKLMPDLAAYYRGKIPVGEVDRIVADCRAARRLVP